MVREVSSFIKTGKSCLQEQVSQVQEEVDRDCLISTIEYMLLSAHCSLVTQSWSLRRYEESYIGCRAEESYWIHHLRYMAPGGMNLED